MLASSHVAANTKHSRPGFRKTSSMLEVDDEGGRMFLRVLIHLTMHDYPPLISGSLQLLFKHFSQRQEVLHTFKQVTLMGCCSGAPLRPRVGAGHGMGPGPFPWERRGMEFMPWECRRRFSS